MKIMISVIWYVLICIRWGFVRSTPGSSRGWRRCVMWLVLGHDTTLTASTQFSPNICMKRNRPISSYFILKSVAQGFVKIHLSQGGLKKYSWKRTEADFDTKGKV